VGVMVFDRAVAAAAGVSRALDDKN